MAAQNLSKNFDENDEPAYWESHETYSIHSSHLKTLFSQRRPKDESKDYQQLQNKADEGDIEAQFAIGSCFQNGEWVPQSYKKAFQYYKLAADQGHSQAQVSLAILYESGLGVEKDYHQAFHYVKLAANQGSPVGFAVLGKFYAEGKGIEKSPNVAIHYYLMAAEHGNVTAWDSLAEAYEHGIGVEASEEKAYYYRQKIFKHHREKANEGDPIDQMIVGWLFENGEGIEKSMKSAIHYYQLSADQNLPKAWFCLAECYAAGKGIPKSSEKAIHYYTLAANQNDALAQFSLAQYLLKNKIHEEQAIHYLKLALQYGQRSPFLLASCEEDLARCFESGIGVRKSAHKALYYYNLAAEHGNEFAQHRLGDAYLKGELELNQSAETAVEYYLLATNLGSSYAMQMLGQCYEKGEGVAQSDVKAFHFYKLASEICIKEGFNSAIYSLAECYELGIGTEKSLDQAAYYYKLAAENGFGSYYRVGCCYMQMGGGENKKKAVAYFKLSVANHESFGQFLLGVAFKQGEGIKQSDEEAFKYFKLAADQGIAEAQSELADCYFKGKGVEVFEEKGFKYKKMAANQDYLPALISLGYYYYHLNLRNDLYVEKAIKCYQLVLNKNISADLAKDIRSSLKKCEIELQELRYAKNLNIQRAQQIHNLPQDELFYPDSKKIDLGEYFQSFNLDALEKILTESQEKACYINESHDFSIAELIVIRDAMLKNPKLTFIGRGADYKGLYIVFNCLGYPNDCLKFRKFRNNPLERSWNAVLFIG